MLTLIPLSCVEKYDFLYNTSKEGIKVRTTHMMLNRMRFCRCLIINVTDNKMLEIYVESK